MKWNVGVMVLALSAAISAQELPTTPKALTVTDATVQQSWSLAGYEIAIPDPANMDTWVIWIRYRHTTSVNSTELASAAHTVRLAGAQTIAALLADVDARIAKAVGAGATAPYFTATRDAIYAYLQAEGYIDSGAQ